MSGVRYLHYWYLIGSEDICGYDYAGVYVNGNSVKTYNLCSSYNSSGWVHQVIDLSIYTGSIINIEFFADTDSSYNSNFFMDDVSITNSAVSGSGLDLNSPYLDLGSIDPARRKK